MRLIDLWRHDRTVFVTAAVLLFASRRTWFAALSGAMYDLHRWVTAYAIIGPRHLTFHYSAQRKILGCLACGRLRLPHEVFFACGMCDDWELCDVCHTAGSRPHTHQLYRHVQPLAVDAAPLNSARCTAEVLAASFALYAPRPCLGWRERMADGQYAHEYSWLSYAAVGEAALTFGAGLEALLTDTSNGRFVCVLGAVCVEWMLADYACALKGIPVVLCHRSTSPEQLAHILYETRATAMITSAHLIPVLRAAAARVDGVSWLRHVVCFHDDAEAYALLPTDHAAWSGAPTPTVAWKQHGWAAVTELGEAQPPQARSRVAYVTPESVVKLLPSSGSTGMPKLVVVTDSRVMRAARAAPPGRRSASAAAPAVVYAYEVMRQSHDVLMQGGSIGFFSGSLCRMLDDCRSLRPTVFAATPTFWNGLHAQFEAELRSELACSGPCHCTEEAAEEDGARREKEARAELLQAWLERRLLGNRIAVLVSTGAPLRHEVQRWLTRVFGRLVLNGYGATETGGITSNGVVSDGVDIRLRDLPTLGYRTSDTPFPRGEILARSDATYFHRERFDAGRGTVAAAQGNEDGWLVVGGVRYFCTGDVGELVGPGQVRVIGRCKSHFKLAQGIYVAPEPLEEIFSRSDLVEQIFVWGGGFMAAVVAVVVVDAELLLSRLNLPRTTDLVAALRELPLAARAERLVLESLGEVAAAPEHRLKPWETPQAVLVELEPFTETRGLLTASHKLSRDALIRHYREQLIKAAGVGAVDEDDPDDAETLQPPPTAGSEGAGEVDGGLCAGLLDVLDEVTGSQRQRTAADSIFSLGLDSLAVARLSSRLSARFGVELPPRALFSLSTLGALEAVLFGGAGAVRRAAACAAIVDWQGEACGAVTQFERAIVELRAIIELRAGSGDVGVSATGVALEGGLPPSLLPEGPLVLLTGATGFLGAFLLSELVHLRIAPRVVCLVRAVDDVNARERLFTAMVSYGLWDAHVAACVIALAADVAAGPSLGLPYGLLHTVAEHAILVVHAAAHVSSALPYTALRAANVGGTAHVAALALHARARLLHISTLGFVDAGHTETLKVETSSLPYRSGYAQSKWVAEAIVAEGLRRYGADAVIFRPGVICGSSRTGASNAKDAVMMLLLGLVRSRIVATDLRSPIPQWFNLVPVDTVAAAIVALGAVTGAEPRAFIEAPLVYHLCAPRSVSLGTICAWLRAAGHELNEVGAEAFCRQVRAVDEEHPWFSLKAQLSRPLAAVGDVRGAMAVEPTMPQAKRAIAAMQKSGCAVELGQRGLARAIQHLSARSPDERY